MDNLLTPIILGIVEGLTEFIPVSSTGHLILSGELLHFTGERAATFEIFIQLGAILAVVMLYRERFLRLFSRRNLMEGLRFKQRELNLAHIAIAILPAFIFGFLLHDIIKKYLFSAHTVLVGLVVGGIVMILAERLPIPAFATNLDKINFRQCLVIGLAQCLSLWPGFSRSGATIAGGLVAGLDHKTAAEFSFIIAVPVMFAATGYDLLKSWQLITPDFMVTLAIGFVVSFIVSVLAIVGFLKLLNRTKLTPFAIYRFILALAYYMVILR
ncbi:Undecaprenyl-diphosphatase [Desulfotomaculum nigrificans CO-1-SRB]|uniref:Undecaprenyl-diphosphatase n=1 Tax=Desulfotomaculum nigrificans (strain DSM 14880 / VKM B-2319 / CO-1-SRB) TaxID=868595 RepID=F6B6X8_DESCC|nr:undecaprenyl-diphosphate phosphatase [Desulfotomaculum nigrificans]AEF93303.1 Undecaprenyl-diphosphatase [Desulfotomaculum nigrificans CO-1-SRB]